MPNCEKSKLKCCDIEPNGNGSGKVVPIPPSCGCLHWHAKSGEMVRMFIAALPQSSTGGADALYGLSSGETYGDSATLGSAVLLASWRPNPSKLNGELGAGGVAAAAVVDAPAGIPLGTPVYSKSDPNVAG